MLVEVDGDPLPRLRSRKALWLLALLALRAGKEVERNWLAGTLWPDVDTAQARTNLRPALSELRSALGAQAFRLDGTGKNAVSLAIEDAEVDVALFDGLAMSDDPVDWARAVELYTGSLLEGCEEEWVTQERDSREQACLHTLLRIAEAEVSEGDFSGAIAGYQEALRISPLWNVAQRGLMGALEMSGDRNGALQAYREFANLLRQETGAFPDEQTADLYLHLRRKARVGAQRPTTPAEPEPISKGNLPHSLSSLVGREDELEEVLALLRRSRLLLLSGFGGIGKTRLALEAGNSIAAEFEDGVWLIELDSLADGSLIFNLIASTLGMGEQPGQSIPLSLIGQLKSKRLLLLLDNCEHILEETALVAELIGRECPEVRILATSRRPLGIKGETIWSVPPMAIPALGHLPQGSTTLKRVLMGYESVRLFLERAEAVQSGFSLTAANAYTVAGICSRLEGIPLAIELAAARVKTISVGEIGKRLDGHLGLLTSGSRVAQPRQQTLRSTIDWSYELLEQAEQTLLCRLWVFAGGFGLAMADDICARDDDRGVHQASIRPLLLSLADKSLIIYDRRTGRYRMLETLRSYALEKLRLLGEEREQMHRYREWFCDLAVRAEPEFDGPGQEAWAADLGLEAGNFRAALDLFVELPVRGLELVGVLTRYWMFKGHYQDGLDAIRQTLAWEGGMAPSVERAKALRGGATMALGRGEVEQAKSYLEESLTISRELEDREGVSLSLCGLGNLAGERQEYATAIALIEESLEIQRELGNQNEIARVLCNLGNVFRRQGRHSAAKIYLEESLVLYREMRDERMITWQLVHLGDVDYRCGNFTSAKSLLDEAVQRFRASDYPRGVAWTLEALANTIVEIDPEASVDALLEESFEFFTRLSEHSSAVLIEYAQGREALRRRDLTKARALLEKSLQTFRELDHGQGEASALELLGAVAQEEDLPTDAIRLYRECLSLRHEVGDIWGVATVLERFATYAPELLAARIWGTTDSIRTLYECPLRPSETRNQADVRAKVRKRLGDKAYTAAWQSGAKEDWSETIRMVLAS